MSSPAPVPSASNPSAAEQHAALIRKNLASLKIATGANVICAEATKALATLQSAARQYDYIFIDPPYAATEDYPRVMKFLAASNILAPIGIIIVEHRKTFNIAESFGDLHRVRLLRQGDAALSFYRRATPPQHEMSETENP
jgi:16S rRNA (guanine966-N2)-methyltransferase